MIKRILLALAFLVASPALAVEHVGGLGTLTLPSTATYDGVKIHASGSWGARIFKTDSTILPGHTYSYSITLANVTAGTAVPYVNGVKMNCSGSWVASPNTWHGELDIADNFTTANAIVSAATKFPDPPYTNHIDNREPDPNGSFRYIAQGAASKFLSDDPMVCPGSPGSSHLHMFWGNTGINAYSTFKSLRTTGGTNIGDPRYPVQRSGIWQPAMLDGAGHVLVPETNLIYYKTIPQSFTECLPTGTDPTTYTDADNRHVGICIPLPNGLRWLGGCDMGKLMSGNTTGRNCLNDKTTYSNGTYNAHFNFACRDSFRTVDTVNGVTDPRYSSLDEALSSGRCTVGRYLYYTLEAQPCWDGKNVDSPDHQSHVAYNSGSISLSEAGTLNTPTATGLQPASGSGDTISAGQNWGKCPAAFPYQIPGFSIQEDWKIDANFSKWHLSCDENMNQSFPRGTCGHMDYWAAWSPTVRDKWEAGCINGRNSGNAGLLCDGTMLAYYGGATPAAMGFNPNSSVTVGDTTNLQQYAFRNRTGFGRELTANGTFTGEIRSVSGGELGIEVFGGFVGDITAFTINDVTTVGKHNGVNGTSN